MLTRQSQDCQIICVPTQQIPKGAKLIEAYETDTEYVIVGDVDSDAEAHNCDEMGCGTFSHVIARFGKEKKS